MKVLRNTDWELIGWLPSLKGSKYPVFIFKSLQYEEIQALTEVKFVDVKANQVYFLNAINKEVTARGGEDLNSHLPQVCRKAFA